MNPKFFRRRRNTEKGKVFEPSRSDSKGFDNDQKNSQQMGAFNEQHGQLRCCIYCNYDDDHLRK